MSQKKTISFQSKKGHRLYGIIHIPDIKSESSRRVGINMVNPGLKNRVAPNRLYIKMADALVKQGYFVLRIDPAGIGDSEGDLGQESTVDIWGQIQQGLFAEDIICSNDFFINECRLDDLVLGGSCGGAISSLLVGDLDKRVSKLFLIDVPVTLSSMKTVTDDYLKIIEADKSYQTNLLIYYLKSLFNPQKWIRLVSMKSDYKAITKVFLLKFKSIFLKSSKNEEQMETIELDNFNYHFLRSFKNVCLSNRKILFLCAEKDTDTQLFNKGFRNVYLNKGNPFEGQYEIHVIQDANHIYTLESSQNDLIQQLRTWLKQTEP